MSESEGATSGVQGDAPVWAGLPETSDSSLDAAAGDERELLVFALDGSAYAIGVERVREIIRMRRLTAVPRSPGWLLGVVALRGEIVEVIDLRRRLELDPAGPDASSRIIVLHGDGHRVTAVLVDRVSEVLRVEEDRVLPAQGLDVSCVEEMCRRGEEYVSILDLDRVLGFSDA